MQGRSMNLSGDLNTTIQINDPPPGPARGRPVVIPPSNRTANELGSPDRA